MTDGRVIFVNRVYWPNESATAQLLADLAPALVARGWEVHVICGNDGPASHQGVSVHRAAFAHAGDRIAVRLWGYLRFLVGARRQLRALVQPGDVIVVKTDPPMLATAVTSLAVRRGARVVQWLQDIYPEIVAAHQGRVLAPLLRPLQTGRNYAWRRAEQVVVVGVDMAAPVRAAGVEERHVCHIPNWAPRELAQMPMPAEVQAWRESRALAGRFVVAYSGNLGRVHEFSTVLDAAERLRDRPDIQFVFIGSGPRRREVEDAAARRGLSSICFLPAVPRPELAVSLAAADVHLVTLRPGFESLVFPSKVAGILAAARPALFVGPSHCALARFIAQERCGATVANGEAERLAALLREWHACPARLTCAGTAARRAFETHFRFESAAERWHSLLTEARKPQSALP